MTPDFPFPLTSTEWLAQNLGADDLIALDASWYLPAMQRDGRAEFAAGHIPGAAFFDIDAISDHSTALPHMMPTPEEFAQAMGDLGVSETMRVVVYDGAGLFSAARVWWMLRAFGMRQVSVLEGGLPKWKLEGRPLEQGATARPRRQFAARLDAGCIADLDTVRAALDAGSAQVADARAAARFRGEAPEPRPGLPSGHMAGAISLPMTDLVANGRLLAPDALRDIIRRAGLDFSKPLITSCGSGVSAAIINLAFEALGEDAPRLYDGSWTEWAGRGMPIATG